MTFSAALVSSLTLIGKIADVRVSHHAATSPDYSTATYHQYSVFTDVGAMVLHNDSHFEAHPAQLCFKELGPYIENNRQHTAWSACERAWRELTLTREKYPPPTIISTPRPTLRSSVVGRPQGFLQTRRRITLNNSESHEHSASCRLYCL